MSVIVSFLSSLTAAALFGSPCPTYGQLQWPKFGDSSPQPLGIYPDVIFTLHTRSNPCSWNSTQTVPVSNLQTPELLTGFRIEFHSQPGMQHPGDLSSPRTCNSQQEANPGQVVQPPSQKSTHSRSFPTLDSFLLLVTSHLSFKARFQVHLFQEPFPDHSGSQGTFIISTTLFSI